MINVSRHCVKSVQIRSFFWSVFSCIRTEYGDLRSGSPYSVRMQENTDPKNSVFGHFLRSYENFSSRLRWIYKICCLGKEGPLLEEVEHDLLLFFCEFFETDLVFLFSSLCWLSELSVFHVIYLTLMMWLRQFTSLKVVSAWEPRPLHVRISTEDGRPRN